MEDLIALAEVVNKQKIKNIEIISEDSKLSPKSKLFYENLVNGNIKSDDDALNILYDQDIIDSKYRKLKSRLKNRLINTLFFIDVQKYGKSERDIIQTRALHMVASMKILKNRGKGKAAMNIAEEALKLTSKSELVDLSIIICQELSFHYGIFNYNKKKDELYSGLLDEQQELLKLELLSKKCFKFFAQQINNRKTNLKLEIPPDIEEGLIFFDSSLSEISNFAVNYNAYNALYFKSYLNRDYNQLESICKRAVKYFRNKKGFSRIGEFSFIQKLGIAYQALGKYKKAIESYNQAMGMNPTAGGVPWYNIRNHLFNTHFAIAQYQIAYNYLLEITRHSSFSKIFPTAREPWLVKEAYIHLLIKMGKVVEDESAENKLRPFRINRFLNEVPHFSKDKRGLNIAILIIHVLFLFINKKEFEIEDRLNALGQYSFRYLRNDETLRSNAFIKMLQKLPLANYHPIRIKRYVDKFHKRLLETPMNISEQSAEIEIIPYEHLWEIVIELLEMRLEKRI